MIVVHLTEKELFEYLKANGCEEYVCSNEMLEDKVVVFEAPDKELVPIQIRSVYYPVHVSRLCEALRIPVPDKIEKYFEQTSELRGKS